jgi:hypothetical protein
VQDHKLLNQVPLTNIARANAFGIKVTLSFFLCVLASKERKKL